MKRVILKFIVITIASCIGLLLSILITGIPKDQVHWWGLIPASMIWSLFWTGITEILMITGNEKG